MKDTDQFREDFNLGEPKPKAEQPKPDRTGWGLFEDIQPVDYFADPCPDASLSNSAMPRILDETPLDFAFHHPKLNPEFALVEAKDTAAKWRGDVVHQLALGKGRGFSIGDFKDWRTKDSQAFKDRAIADGLTPVLREKFEEAEVLAEVVVEKVKRVTKGADYKTEVVFMYQEETASGPIWVRGMIDIWVPELALIIDPKITPMLYNATVGRQLINMGWDRQAALYPRALGKIFPELAGRIQFADLMVKPEPPYTSRFVSTEGGWNHTSVKQCRIAFERFGACLYAGRWPGFGDDIFYASLPPWEEKRREAMELESGL